MTMHQALQFLDALHEHIRHSVDKPGPWCAPTAEVVQYNLRLNRAAFPHDRDVSNSYRGQFKIARARHWVSEGPCQHHCHANHQQLTAAGHEALRLMDEQGCGPYCDQHRETKLHLERKVA